MRLAEFLKNLVETELHGETFRFDELWTLVPDFSAKLRSFDSEWLHWSPKTLDGWYCVPSANGFDVYYQERSIKGDRYHFPSEREAVRAALNASIFPLGQRELVAYSR